MQLDAQVGGQDLKVVQPCKVGFLVGAERAAVLVVHCHCQSIIFISSYFLYALILGKNTCRYKTRPSCRFNLSMQIETAGRK